MSVLLLTQPLKVSLKFAFISQASISSQYRRTHGTHDWLIVDKSRIIEYALDVVN